MITRPVQQVVLLGIAGDTRLQERPRVQHPEREGRQQDGGEERIGYGMPERPDLPRREDSKRSLQPAEVPVGLSRRAHGGGSERAVEPYRVDLEQSSYRAEHGSDSE